MDKKELEEIVNLTELKKYKESKEYKAILKDCEDQTELSREVVRKMYHENVTKEQIYDFHDKTYNWIEYLREKLEQIKSDTKWAEALKKEITGDIIFNDKMITWQSMDKYNNVYSQVLLNNYDMERLEWTRNRLFPQILDWLINTLENTEEKVEEEIY